MPLFEPLVRAGDANARRQSLADAFREVRSLTMALSTPLETEDQQVQSCLEVSPTKWHLAHTTWFFETFVLPRADKGYEPLHSRYEYLFNSYYNSVGPMHARPNRGLLTRPTLSDVQSYRTHVEDKVLAIIGTADSQVWQEIEPILELGLHHEQQHQELILTDIKHVLSCNPLMPAAYPRPATAAGLPQEEAALAYVAGPEGPFEIGNANNETHKLFCFDHEGPRHIVYLTPHELGDRLDHERRVSRIH